jgi:hypothetical protein
MKLQVRHLGSYTLFDEWVLEADSDTAWFVRLYHLNSLRRGFEAGDYAIEVFTSQNTFQPLRRMTAIETALFQLALAHCLRGGAEGY